MGHAGRKHTANISIMAARATYPNRDALGSHMTDLINHLHAHGYARTDFWPHIYDYLAYLKKCPAYNGHVLASGDGVPRTLEDALAQTTGTNCGYACYSMADTLKGPGLMQELLPMTMLAAEYFGEEPLLYSVNAFWKKSFSDADWHFDQDDRKIFVMFMYGSDILVKEDGPHAYVKGSHTWSEESKDWLHTSKQQPASAAVETFYGPAGTCFFTDTRGLHKGHAPKETPRLLIWARWGVSDPPHAYIGDKLSPVPCSELPFFEIMPLSDRTRNRLKLVIDWNS